MRIHSLPRHHHPQAIGNCCDEPEQSAPPPPRGLSGKYDNDRSRSGSVVHQFHIGPLGTGSFLESTLPNFLPLRYSIEISLEQIMPTYQGKCHCGSNRFEIDAEIGHVRECDCSICRRRGALIFRVLPDQIRFLTPLEQLFEYRWGTRTGVDYFCAIGGVMPFRRPSAPTPEEIAAGMVPFDGWAINVRCIDELNLEDFPRVRVRGSHLKI
mgnify:CR=1 FL=1